MSDSEGFRADESEDPDDREVRTTVTFDTGESTAVKLTTGFRSDKLGVDPDAKALPLRRNEAVAMS